jgi:hypothetical protein
MILYHDDDDPEDKSLTTQEAGTTQESMGLMTMVLYGPFLGILLLVSIYILFSDRQYSLACGTWYARIFSVTWMKRVFILVFATLMVALQADAVTLSLYFAIVYCTIVHDFFWRSCPSTEPEGNRPAPFSTKEWSSIQRKRAMKPEDQAARNEALAREEQIAKRAREQDVERAQALRTDTETRKASLSAETLHGFNAQEIQRGKQLRAEIREAQGMKPVEQQGWFNQWFSGKSDQDRMDEELALNLGYQSVDELPLNLPERVILTGQWEPGMARVPPRKNIQKSRRSKKSKSINPFDLVDS